MTRTVADVSNAAEIVGVDGSGNPAVAAVIGSGLAVYGLMRKAHDLPASTTYSSTEILGFTVDAAGSSTWEAVFIDGGTITFTATTGKDYYWHLSSITSPSGGTAILGIP